MRRRGQTRQALTRRKCERPALERKGGDGDCEAAPCTRASKEAVAKPRATPVVTLKRLAANLSESHEMSKKQTEAVLGDLVGLVTKHLKRGDRIRLGGLGILQVRKRAARMGRNPATAERIQLLGPAVIRERPQQKKYRVCLLNNLLRARMSRLPALWRYCVVKRSARVT